MASICNDELGCFGVQGGHGRKTLSLSAMTLGEAMRMVAKLGGFLGRKSDGEPGTETLWRGLLCLDGMTMGWRWARGP